MLGIEAIRGLLPSVHIKGVVLQDPKQIQSLEDEPVIKRTGREMNVRIKTSAITTADNALEDINSIGGDFLAVPNFNFNEHIKVAVIQSSDADTTSVLQSMGSEITRYIGPLNNWKGNDKFDDLLYSTVAVNRGVAKNKMPEFKKLHVRVITKGLFDQIEKPILEKIDQDGNEVRSVPIDFTFTISSSNPSHLTYFVLCYLDFDSMVDSLRPVTSNSSGVQDLIDLDTSDFDKIGTMSTPLKNETVFDDGRISSSTFFFKTLKGKIWTGPVHQTPSGEYMTGNRDSADSVWVELLESQNVKIQDFRNREGMASVRIMDDFRDEEAQVRSIVSGFSPKNRQLDPITKSAPAYISDLFLSFGTRKMSKFMFLINFDDLMTNNSIFGKVFKTNIGSLRKKIFGLSSIKSLKIFRDEVRKTTGTNSIGSAVDRFTNKTQSPPVVISAVSQEKGRQTISGDSKITEETNMSFSGANIRSFNVIDKNFNSTSRGMYRYRIELEVIDGTIEFLRQKVSNLRDFANTLENYSSDVSNSIVRDDDPLGSDDPHVSDTRVLVRTREVGGYDPILDNLTQNYAVLAENKYAEDVQSGIEEFLEILKMFSAGRELDQAQERSLSNFLYLITNSKTTNPESILTILELLQNTIAKITAFIGENVEITDPKIRKSENVTSAKSDRGVIYIEKRFNNILDFTKHSAGGYDYLSRNTAESAKGAADDVGLRTIPGSLYRERADRETLKFFKTTQPEITEGMTAGTVKYAGSDSARKSALSFLSPSIVRINPPVDVLNADRVEDNSLVRLLEATAANNLTDIENSDLAPKPNPGFSNKARNISKRAYSKDGEGGNTVALTEQVGYFDRNFSLSTNTQEVATLADRANDNVQLPSDDEDAAKGNEKSNRPTATSAPLALYTKIFQRDLDKNKNSKDSAFAASAHEDASEVFNLNNNKNYLAGISQTAVSSLPNQIKALFMSCTGNSSNVKFYPATSRSRDVFKDPGQSSSAKMKYKLLVEVQYLAGFEVVLSNSRSTMLLSAPKFRKLTSTVFSKFVGKKLICRLKKYEIPRFGILRPKKLDLPIYDEYFILEPDTPLEGVDPRDVEERFLLDATTGPPRRRPGFGKEEFRLSDISEFGVSRKPGKNKKLRSLRKKELLRKISEQKQNINSSLVANAFNSNVSQGGRFVASVGAGTQVSERIKSLARRTRRSKKDTGLRVKYVNPSLTTKINPSIASAKSLISSPLSTTRLPELKIKLDKLKQEMSLLKNKITGLNKKINTERMEKDQRTGKQVKVRGGIEGDISRNRLQIQELESANDPSGKSKALKERLERRNDALTQSARIYRRSLAHADKRSKTKKKEIDKVSTEIAQEAKKLQKEIIAQRVGAAQAKIEKEAAKARRSRAKGAASQTKKTASPYIGAEGLQNIFSLDVTKTDTPGDKITPADVKKLMGYGSYMTSADSDNYDTLLKELSSFVDGEDLLSETEVVASVLSDIKQDSAIESLREDDDLGIDFVSLVDKLKSTKQELSSILSEKQKRAIVAKEISQRIERSDVPHANRERIIKTILEDVFE